MGWTVDRRNADGSISVRACWRDKREVIRARTFHPRDFENPHKAALAYLEEREWEKAHDLL
jgi:hypothetical protein